MPHGPSEAGSYLVPVTDTERLRLTAGARAITLTPERRSPASTDPADWHPAGAPVLVPLAAWPLIRAAGDLALTMARRPHLTAAPLAGESDHGG